MERPEPLLPPLDELLALSPADRLRLGAALARTLGPSWRASEELVGTLGLIELVHTSGHPFVAIGSTRFVRGLRDDERESLVTAMLGPGADEPSGEDREAARREIPLDVLPPVKVAVPAFLIGREPLSVERGAALGGTGLQDLGYLEALGDLESWEASVRAFPDGLRLATEDEWELVAREGGSSSWIVPVPERGYGGMWPPEEIFSLENALGVRGLAVAEVFAGGFRRGVGDGRGNWGGPTGNAELHAAARWRDAFGGCRLARSLADLGPIHP
ncbi:MAG: hypothetical protein H6738_14520 [Alphaproteobacteria bacterium]|nr:hypothetical protein [Alphaproteobacteria bacterium]MCB9697989.1 hypothetical protein [Alphaproteobacteria bacterium]